MLIWRNGFLLATAGLAAMTMSACGTESTSTGHPLTDAASHTTASSSTPSVVAPVGVPTITWEQPIPGGQDVTQAVTLDHADTLGLPFDPVTADVPGSLLIAQVSGPTDEHPRLGMLYRLSAADTTSADPRLVVYEQLSDITAADLEEAATEGERELVTLGDSTALLVRNADQGRLTFVTAGIRFDVMGPSLSIDDALMVSRALEAQARDR